MKRQFAGITIQLLADHQQRHFRYPDIVPQNGKDCIFDKRSLHKGHSIKDK